MKSICTVSLLGLLLSVNMNAQCWQQVAAGGEHTLAIKNNGTLWAWGSNSLGKLGIGMQRDQYTPVQVGSDSNWAQVTAGGGHSLAIKSDGTLWAWGSNYAGQLGIGTYQNQNIPVQVGSDSIWAQVTTGHTHTLAIKSDGTLWAWGLNEYDQLGIGSTANQNTPVQVGFDVNWQTVTAGGGHTLAIKTNGTLWAWGWNEYGQLGTGTLYQNEDTPVQIGNDQDWKQVSGGGSFTMAIKTFGTLWAWGSNTFGQLGLYGTMVLTPKKVGLGTWHQVEAGYTHTIATRFGETCTWGHNNYGQLGDGTYNDHTTPKPILPTFINSLKQVAAGGYFTVGIAGDGTIRAWGWNYYGQLGIGPNQTNNTAEQTGVDTNWAFATAGGYHSSAIKTDGSLWTWGGNGYWQLGWPWPFADQNTPVQISSENNWTTVSAGSRHTLAIKKDSTLWACGYNIYGQLGIGSDEPVSDLRQVATDHIWQQVATGWNHTVAVKTNGTLWAWGRNNYGQLGIGTKINMNHPVQVGTDTNWQQVAAGGLHTLAIKKDGTLWAWGFNFDGELGIGFSNLEQTSPVQVGLDTNWQQLSAGEYHTLAIKKDGTLWAWGYNIYGELGIGTDTSQNVPVVVGTTADWHQIAAGGGHTLAIKKDGTLWAWGYNIRGELGIGSTANQNTPVQVGFDVNWQTVTAGGGHTLAIKTDGTLWAWGWNEYGQLGNGTFPSRYTTPREVSCIISGAYNPVSSSVRVHLFPNPAQQHLSIQLGNIDAWNLVFEIRDVLGTVVFPQRNLGNNQGIDISRLAPGVYILLIHTDRGQISRQFVKI